MEGGARRFCEIGGGRKPNVSLARVQEFGLDYVVFDASREQLDNTPSGYALFHGSILDSSAVAELLRERGTFDVVLTHFCAEHIPDAKAFHEQIFAMLRPGGTAVHFFPTLYAVPFVANRLLAESLSSALVSRTLGKNNKFPAYYSWCRGPTRKQVRALESIGYSVDRYVGFFGHGYYARIAPLHLLHRGFVKAMLARPLPSLTSFALVVLTRPLD